MINPSSYFVSKDEDTGAAGRLMLYQFFRENILENMSHTDRSPHTFSHSNAQLLINSLMIDL